MENSISKSILASEESSWTTYFEDFFHDANYINESDQDYDQQASSFSLISDAASLMAAKTVDIGEEQDLGVAEQMCIYNNNDNNRYNRLSFEKRKTIDQDLEDTASSPLNSPKDKESCSNQMMMNKERRNNDDCMKDGDCNELKRRGLCLVPLSMVRDTYISR
ncbi:uncharacterized protein LOC110825218 [Carica papaya]|uniref:uncharacterized protein LOC110825218 n=1 Tax=Carica papaya TaxID=3649 RepID=UPI000B8CF6D3|nr:uncharacterized protein LOC110825218 [Carica papaya]